jgi:hypothetical protein
MNLWNLRNAALALLTLTALAFAGDKPAKAQYPAYRPFPVYGYGQTISISPGRFAPGANIAVPGSVQHWSNPYTGQFGRSYIGLDGRPHGFSYTPTPYGGHYEVSRVRR